MKIHLSWPIIISILLIPTLPATAQTGLVQKEFTVKEGKIIVSLPDDMRQGDIISGTVIAEPSGNNEKEKNRNAALLRTYKVSAGTIVTSVSDQRQPIKFNIAESKPAFLVLSDSRNNTINSLPVSLINDPSPSPSAITMPTHVMTESSFLITGPFDGDIATTKCRIDGKEMEILAESPRQTIVTMPLVPSGAHTITIEEKGIGTNEKISAVNMALSSPKTMGLFEGEKTTITVEITGLQDLPSDATLTVTNLSASTVILSGGITQVITITPSQVRGNGTFRQIFNAQSLAVGNFDVNANLQLPRPDSVQYSPPQNIMPADGKVFTKEEAEQPILFEWTPVLPKPKADIIYKIRVVEIKAGQTKEQAVKTNTAIAEAEIKNTTQTSFKLPGVYDSLAWNVEATGGEIPANYRKSKETRIRIGGAEHKNDWPGKRYAPPVNQTPADGKVFTKEEVAQSILFSWTPVLPAPATDVLYRIRIVEILSGQTKEQAVKTNRPFFEKEMNNQTQFTTGNGSTIVIWPRTSNAAYAWYVQATSANGTDYGNSNPGTFSVSNCFPNVHLRLDSARCSQNSEIIIKGTIFANTFPGVIVNNIVFNKIVEYPSYTPVSYNNLSPATINTAVNTAFSITARDAQCKKVLVEYSITYTCFSGTITSHRSDTITLPCCCRPCELNRVSASNLSMTVLNTVDGTVTVINNVTASPNNVIKIVADLVAVSIIPNNPDCNRCDKDRKNQDNFIGLNRILINSLQWTNAGNGTAPPNSSARITRSLVFTSTNFTGVNMSGTNPIRHTIGLSPVSCCGDKVEIWIRYSVWDRGCHVCEKVVKSTLNRTGACTTTSGGGNNGSGTTGGTPQSKKN